MRRSAPLLLASSVLIAAPARAEERPIAEALFQAGRALMSEGRFDEACPKLAESQRIEPGGGTILLLALCHAHQGKHASASAELRSALSIARRDRRADRERLAEKHLEMVEPKVSRVVVTTADRDVELALDGTPISADAARVPLPLDPGAHELRASAKGKKTRTIAIRIANGETGETRTVAVPPLDDEPRPPVVATRAPEPTPTSPLRLVGLGSAGLGLAAVAAGGIFGLRAIDANGDAKRICDPSRCADPRGMERNDQARTSASTANVLVGIGAGLIVAGVVLVFVTPKDGRSFRAASAGIGF